MFTRLVLESFICCCLCLLSAGFFVCRVPTHLCICLLHGQDLFDFRYTFGYTHTHSFLCAGLYFNSVFTFIVFSFGYPFSFLSSCLTILPILVQVVWHSCLLSIFLHTHTHPHTMTAITIIIIICFVCFTFVLTRYCVEHCKNAHTLLFARLKNLISMYLPTGFQSFLNAVSRFWIWYFSSKYRFLGIKMSLKKRKSVNSKAGHTVKFCQLHSVTKEKGGEGNVEFEGHIENIFNFDDHVGN